MADEPTIELTMQAAAGAFVGRLTLPLRVQVEGIEAVLVSAAAYDALLQAGSKSVGARSRVERDPELQRFVDERLSLLDLPTLLGEIVHRFGPQRAPSLSGLHRYAMARRRAAEAVTRPTGSRRGPRGPR